MNPIIVIPARMGSTRLPGKPLADICGRAMILRVADAAQKASVGPVVIAAGDQEILDVAVADGLTAVMTDPDLPSGTDRSHAAIMGLDPERKYDVVVNLQGDAPGLDPAHIKMSVDALLRDDEADIATLAVAVDASVDANNPNAVKSVLALEPSGAHGFALYFTRAAAPYGEGPLYHHAGIYTYRRAALEQFCTLPPSPLEIRERLEQLRALENGMKMTVAMIDETLPSVDTQEDLERVRLAFSEQS